MRTLLCLLLALAVPAQEASRPSSQSRVLFGEIDGILKELSEITGWKVKRKVPAAFISKDQLQHYVESRVRKASKPEEVRIQTLTLKLFGLVPEDFDLEKSTVDLVTEQAAAFYDYDKKRLFVTESPASFIEQRIVLVHELAHALADQQFSLKRYVRKGGDTDDDSAAREAVMEGQATWLMWAYSSRVAGGDPRPSETVLETMRNATTGAGGAQFPVYDQSPLYLRETLVFPYNQGVVFQEAVFERRGRDAFREVFEHAPRSTAEILHPGSYFDRRPVPNVALPEIPRHKEYRVVAEGSVGELDHRILAEQFCKGVDAGGAAAGWRAGKFKVFESKKGKRPLLVYGSEWESPAAAKEWLGLYRKVLAGKSKSIEFTPSPETELRGRNERGYFRVRVNERQVISIEGLPDSTID